MGNAYHAPKIRVGGFDPLSGEAYQQNPQKAHPWAERRHTTYRLSQSVHRSWHAFCHVINKRIWWWWWRCDLCAWRRDKGLRKKDKDRNPTVANWVFAKTTHVVGSIWNFAWWLVFRRSKIRISSKSVKRFRSCGGRNLPTSIDLAIGLYNSLYYRTSRDCFTLLY